MLLLVGGGVVVVVIEKNWIQNELDFNIHSRNTFIFYHRVSWCICCAGTGIAHQVNAYVVSCV